MIQPRYDTAYFEFMRQLDDTGDEKAMIMPKRTKDYTDGLRDGEKRLLRAVRQWLDWMIDQHLITDPKAHEIIQYWLTARLKKGSK